jgi:flagellar secretion chaperone FliS
MNLKQSDVASLYSQVKVQGGSALGLIVALYDTILRDLRRADGAIERNDIEKRTFELNHALRVIAELENSLDRERGGNAAARLQRFYAVTRGMILEASIRNSREAIGQLVEVFGTMRQAWHEADLKMDAERNAPKGDRKPPHDGPGSNAPIMGDPSAETPRGNWSA